MKADTKDSLFIAGAFILIALLSLVFCFVILQDFERPLPIEVEVVTTWNNDATKAEVERLYSEGYTILSVTSSMCTATR